MGRDSYRGRGQGGRGRGRGRYHSDRNKSSGTKSAEMKFYMHGSGKQQQLMTYTTVKDHIVQFVQKTYKNGQDVAISLRNLQKMDLTGERPRRGEATSLHANEARMEQSGLDIVYQAQITRYIKRVETLDQNLTRAYALIYSTYCNRTLQNRIEEHPDFEKMIRDNPIELLKVIQILMHDPVRAKYPYALLTEAVARTLNIKQMENENLIDYVKRFKQA